MFKLLLLTPLLIISISCDNNSPNNRKLNNSNEARQNNMDREISNSLSILNKIRLSVNMNKFNINNNLMFSSQKHSNYLYRNKTTGHNESRSGFDFYETTAQKRTIKAGYLSLIVSENISVGQVNTQESIDSLMSGIYHRFGFLDFNIDELGYGKTNLSYTYNMGNSYLNSLCKNKTSFTSAGKSYYGVCKNKKLKIEASIYDEKKNIIINNNPSYVIYPNRDAINIPPVFYEESPDPLPNYGVSGYPISIQFNPNKIITSSISIDSFTLKDSNNKLLDDILIMSKDNDHNHKFKEGQFALFPKNRLEYNSKYSVNINYREAGRNKKISWSFRTAKLNQIVHRITASQNINIQSNREYALYIVPKNRNDTLGSVSYKYDGGINILKSEFIDKNTYAIKVSGAKGKKITITFSNRTVVTLIIN